MNNAPVTAEDLYLYAMGLLDDAEQTRLDEFLKQSPEARAELINVRSDLGLLALSVELQSPTPSARMRLLKEITREPKATVAAKDVVTAEPVVEAVAPANNIVTMTPVPTMAADQPESTRRADIPLAFRSSYAESAARERSMMATVSPWLGWAVAAGLAVTAWDFYQKTEVLSNQVTVATAKADRSAATSAKAEMVLDTMRSGTSQRFMLTRQNTQPVAAARVTYLAENGALVFQGNNLDPLPPEKTYELWLIPAGAGRKPIPAGTFKPDARGFASVIMPELPKGIVAGSFGVTMEDDGGSQVPTLPILMIGS